MVLQTPHHTRICTLPISLDHKHRMVSRTQAVQKIGLRTLDRVRARQVPIYLCIISLMT